MKRLYSIISFLFILSFGANAQVAIDSAADFSVKDIDGNLHHLFGYLDAGNFVVIDFYTTNCGPCQTYASEISASYHNFGCNQGNVVYLGMNWGSDNLTVHAFDSIWGAEYPSVSGLQGGGNAVVDLYQVQSYPTVILIAPDRSILNNHIWPPDQSTLDSIVTYAGGIAMPCTVDVPVNLTANLPEIRFVSESSGVTHVYTSNFLPGSLLTIHSSDGREVYSGHISSSGNSIQLRSGIYIAGILSEGQRVLSRKFFAR